MRRTTTTAVGLVALVVMLVLGVFSAGSASAHLFLYTGPLPSLLLILSEGPQIFNVTPEGFQINCPHFLGHIQVSNGVMWGLTAKVTGDYPGKCTVTGGSKGTISPVEYEISADGTISILKTITITAGSPANCSLLVEPTAENQNLSSLLFLKDPLNSGAILGHAAVGGIHSKGTNGLCSETEGNNHTKGSYFGLFLVWVHGGTVAWE